MKAKDNQILNAKSIHFFAYPFVYDKEIKVKRKKMTFSKCLETFGWQRKEMDFRKITDVDRMREAYMFEQYVSCETENIFSKRDNPRCEIYEYRTQEDKDGDIYYRIQLQQKTYDLLILSLELHIYHNGIGILFVNSVNEDSSITIDDIKIINDMGRKISLPFIPREQNGYIECPEKIGIVKKILAADKIENANWMIMTDYRSIVDKLLKREYGMEELSFLEKLINLSWDTSIGKKHDIKVREVNDYRMFLMCMISDEKLSEQIKNRDEDEVAFDKLWYSILHADEGEASCQHSGMRKSILEKETYWRWADYGTLYGITQYSFVGVTENNAICREVVIKPFYSEYLYMMSLVLAQRISLVEFSEQAEEIALRMNESKKIKQLIKRKICKELIDLQEAYIVWKNEMLIPEFSNQEQGIELYQLMQESMMVYKKKLLVDDQLRGMYEVVTVSNGTRVGWWSLVWAVAAIILTVVSYFVT